MSMVAMRNESCICITTIVDSTNRNGRMCGDAAVDAVASVAQTDDPAARSNKRDKRSAGDGTPFIPFIGK